jgi:aspartate aminotransferase
MRALSTTIRALEESRTLALTNEARRLRAAGVDIISLTAGEPDFPTPRHAKQAAIRAIEDNFTGYTATEGIPELLEAIRGKFARENGLRYTQEQILVSAGAKQSVFNTLQAVCSQGDEVVFFRPYWVSYPALVQLARAVPVVVPPFPGRRFRPNLEGLRKVLSPRTRVLLLNTPCNPTGDVLSSEELEEIAAIALERDLYIISDEVYERMVYDGRKHVSIGALPGMADRVITVSSVSKSHAMPGWRIGYLGGPPEVVLAAKKVQGHTTTCNNSVAQKAATAALTGPQGEMGRMVEEFRSRRDIVFEMLRGLPGLVTSLPEGAMFYFPGITGFLDVPHGKKVLRDDVELAAYLLREHHVAVVPGSAFGEPGHLRLSFSSPEAILTDGVRRLVQGLERIT